MLYFCHLLTAASRGQLKGFLPFGSRIKSIKHNAQLCTAPRVTSCNLICLMIDTVPFPSGLPPPPPAPSSDLDGPTSTTTTTLYPPGVHRELSLILKEIRVITDKIRDDEDTANIENDWKFAAMVLDRVCLITFTFFTIVATVAVLLSAPHIIVT